MKYVIMISHGEFAPGLHSAVKMMCGERGDVLSTSLKEEMSTDEFGDNFKKLIEPIHQNDDIILLADILSGSPFTNALAIVDEKGMMNNTLVISGMNMPLAISAVLMKDNYEDINELKKTILKEGHAGLCEFVMNTEEDNTSDIL